SFSRQVMSEKSGGGEGRRAGAANACGAVRRFREFPHIKSRPAGTDKQHRGRPGRGRRPRQTPASDSGCGDVVRCCGRPVAFRARRACGAMTRAVSIISRPLRRRFRPRAAAAFSLFELLFVIAIIAIIAAMAMPKYGRSVARYRAQCAARRVAADLMFARSAAKSASAERVVTFNAVAGSYT